MIEILAGRLLAPYVGVSHETFTGIIGVVLAGIAMGAWAGGVAADQREPRKLIAIALAAGGVLTWLILPILDVLGPQLGSGVAAIVMLSLFALFLPAAVLSAVSPMVAKLRLGDLGETGTVVGGLSAAGTIGALAGTFITGFVLVAALPTRLTVLLIGLVLVLAGAVLYGVMAKSVPSAAAAVLVAAGALLGVTSTQPCQFDTSYFCANVIVDEDNAAGRSLYLDGLRHAYVDLDDPANLDIRYIRVFAHVSEALGPGALDTLHIGGGGFSFPRQLNDARPGSTSIVLEIDPALVDVAEDELGLQQSDALRVEVGDGRLALDDYPDDSFDLVVGDAFGSRSVPWHLTTEEFLSEVDRVLTPGGIYVMNVIDRGSLDFARAEAATLTQVFSSVQVVMPPDDTAGRGSSNFVLVASASQLPPLTVPSEDGSVLTQSATADWIGNAESLRDDFAPVDQLLD